MNRFYFVLCVVVMVSSCSLIERFRPVQEYDWSLDQESIEVYEDLQVTLNVLGSSVPDIIEWSCEPENFVRYIVSDGGKRCLVQRLEDGECTLVARGGELEKRVQVMVERYSKSGLHLRINGEDMYFPYEYSVWQYSDKGTVAGIDGAVDMNIAFGPIWE